MKAIKNTVALLLGMAAASTEFVPETKQELFKLDEDNLVINPTQQEQVTPDVMDEPVEAVMGP